MGPQNAVTIAVKTPDKINNLLRVDRILMPRFSAYLTPNNNALRGFTSKNERNKDMITNEAKNGSRSNVTPEKLPSPQMTNECTPSCVEKKFSKDIADDDR